MDAARFADEERTPDTDEHGYVEVQKPNNGQASAAARAARSLGAGGAGSPPKATSIHQAGDKTTQFSRIQLERDMETSTQFRKEALSSRRFVDAARYQTMIWKSRHSLSEFCPFPIDEKLDMLCQHVDILLECDELHKDSFPREADELELEQNAHRLDPRKWGELCASMRLLYMRWTALQDLDKAKRYLKLALASLAKLDSCSDILAPISQDLVDIYNLQGDLGGAQEYIKDDVSRCRSDGPCPLLVRETWAEIGTTRRSRCTTWYFTSTARREAARRWYSRNYACPHEADGSEDTMTSISSDILLLAAATGNADTAALLIDAGANIDALDQQGRSGLHRCQSCPENGTDGGLRLAKLLLEKKTSLVNHQDAEEKTALIMACEAGRTPMVELLLGYGADPSVRDMHGKTCLYTACEKGDLEIVRTLLRAAANRPTARGLDINARGPGGCTPIIMAVRAASANRKKVSIVRELKRHDADPSIRDHRGNDAFQYVTGLAARDIEQALGEPGTEEHSWSARSCA